MPEEADTVPVSSNGTIINAAISGELAELDMDSSTVEDLISSTGKINIDLNAVENITGAVIPANALKAIAEASGIEEFSISLPDAELTFDKTTLGVIGASSASEVTIKAARVKAETLTEAQKALVGDRPVIDLTLTADGKTISDFGSGRVTVRIPYTLHPGENPGSVVVWHLNDKGILEPVTGRYDAATGSVVFSTDHFSKYVIGSLPFEDVDRDMWYFDSISYVYANGLLLGTDDAVFSPREPMTRAMLVTVLWRIEGKPAAADSEFSDVHNGQWYTEAVTWAAKNGIVSGYGNGLFGPNNTVTREQMAVILMNYARYKGYDTSASADLNRFSDSTEISSWAKPSMEWANAEGIINGIGGGLIDPKGFAERCQVAAILQRFITKL